MLAPIPPSNLPTRQHSPQGDSSAAFGIYVCPKCKGALASNHESLSCEACRVTYPIVEGIPDFVLGDLTQSTHPILRRVKGFERLAPIYETKLCYPLLLNLYGGLGSTSLQELRQKIAEIVDIEKGLILDVACGPGTLGRRIASPSKAVYGIDVSMAMLRKGIAYVKHDHNANVHFSRAMAEALPFQDVLFDASICGGALHLFADAVLALREIARTMKNGAPLGVTTFIAGNTGIVRFHRVRKRLQERGVHVFEIAELEKYLVEAGLESFRPQVYGSLLVFSARKRKS